MRALCLITVKPGIIDRVTEILLKKRKISREIMTVTGRADICVLLHGSLTNINNAVLEFKKIKVSQILPHQEFQFASFRQEAHELHFCLLDT